MSTLPPPVPSQKNKFLVGYLCTVSFSLLLTPFPTTVATFLLVLVVRFPIVIKIKLCYKILQSTIEIVNIFVSIALLLFQTKTQMNDLMDGLIQDMSTGTYTTKRPYPVARFVACAIFYLFLL